MDRGHPQEEENSKLANPQEVLNLTSGNLRKRLTQNCEHEKKFKNPKSLNEQLYDHRPSNDEKHHNPRSQLLIIPLNQWTDQRGDNDDHGGRDDAKPSLCHR